MAKPSLPKLPSINQPLMDTLTPREQAFVLHPDVFSDPVGAATAAGYSPNTARCKAYQMRKDLMYFIAPLHEARIEKTGVTVDRIKDELAAIAFANEVDYYDTVDTDTGTVKYVRDLTRLPPAMQRAIKTITYQNTILASGETIQEVASIELYDKLSALKELAEIFGLHDARLRKPNDANAGEDEQIMEHMEPADREAVIKLLDKAAARAKAVDSKKRDREAINVTPTRK